MISIRLPENPEKALVFWAVVGVLVLILLILLFVLLSRKRKEAGRKQREELERSLKDALAELFRQIPILILPTRGLDSFYAERGGLIIGF